MLRPLILMQVVMLALIPLAGAVMSGDAAGSYLAMSAAPLPSLDVVEVTWSGLGTTHLGVVHGVPDAMRAAGLVPLLDMGALLAFCGVGGSA